MKYTIKMLAMAGLTLGLVSFTRQKVERHSLTVQVSGLRNATGTVQFALYNKAGSIPDQEYRHYYRRAKSDIRQQSAAVTFAGLPAGKYAVSILHDENGNGKIDKGLVLPKEGVGFSNYKSLHLNKRPDFAKASFHVNSDTSVVIKLNYF
jgi:uncharacterized protein (DUF2141 family)